MIEMKTVTIKIGTKIFSLNHILITTCTNPVVRMKQNTISDTFFKV